MVPCRIRSRCVSCGLSLNPGGVTAVSQRTFSPRSGRLTSPATRELSPALSASSSDGDAPSVLVRDLSTTSQWPAPAGICLWPAVLEPTVNVRCSFTTGGKHHAVAESLRINTVGSIRPGRWRCRRGQRRCARQGYPWCCADIRDAASDGRDKLGLRSNHVPDSIRYPRASRKGADPPGSAPEIWTFHTCS